MKKTVKNTTLALFASLFFLILGFFYYSKNISHERNVDIGGHIFRAAVVSSEQDRERGLGGQEKIGEGEAMLFVFEDSGRHAFWMKDMRFDLDIIWILNGKIVYIAKNVSHMQKETIMPDVFADYVLEINSGLSDKYGFREGEKIKVK